MTITLGDEYDPRTIEVDRVEYLLIDRSTLSL